MPFDPPPRDAAPPEPKPPVFDTGSEQYRHECECRYVKSLKVSDRLHYLAGVRTKRGDAPVERIMKDLGKACLEELTEEIGRRAADHAATRILR
ncbi:MAG: hypothetical protein OEW90_01010 [Betaproteobacteria bacterium]|nr:hypothetical protein [Betaproteobacteria bacterium]MDH4322697.1 hypothetical protein [Betaproteobacteria bacterium]